MIRKVLIAEDQESANISIQKTMDDLGITHIDYVYYCDDAFDEIKKAKHAGKPYDLLITDLYFEQDHRIQIIKGGEALIVAARQVQVELKVLVFSGEGRHALIKNLFTKSNIDGYVRKARNDVKELKQALNTISNNQRYIPKFLVTQKNTYDFDEFDVTVITMLAQGLRQKDIPAILQQKNIQPSGLSSIEKRLNLIREALAFSNNEQLVVYCKTQGII